MKYTALFQKWISYNYFFLKLQKKTAKSSSILITPEGTADTMNNRPNIEDDSITPTLRDTLHWLPVRERIDFKLCLLVYKCLHQLAAPYLESMIFPVSACSVNTSPPIRSAGQGDLTVPRTRTVGFGPRSFSVAGPSLWNTLPSDMKQSCLSIVQFCSQLKSVMFVSSFYAWAQPS